MLKINLSICKFSIIHFKVIQSTIYRIIIIKSTYI